MFAADKKVESGAEGIRYVGCQGLSYLSGISSLILGLLIFCLDLCWQHHPEAARLSSASEALAKPLRLIA